MDDSLDTIINTGGSLPSSENKHDRWCYKKKHIMDGVENNCRTDLYKLKISIKLYFV